MQQAADLAVILDVETTGLHEPQVIELAESGPLEFGDHITEGMCAVSRFKPTKAIEPGAMATHRIIAEDLEHCRPWVPWQPAAEVGYLVGHAIDSDWSALGQPPLKRICTLAIAKRVWSGFASFKLSTLMFELYEAKIARELTENAHEAEQDVYLTGLLLDHLLHEIPNVHSWGDLWKFSEDARVPLRIGFGKHGPKNGQPGALYAEIPAGYLRWMIEPVRVNDMDPWEVKAAQRQLGILL